MSRPELAASVSIGCLVLRLSKPPYSDVPAVPVSQPFKRRFQRCALIMLLGLVALVGLDQAVVFLVLGDGEVRGIRVAPFDPPRFHAGSDREWERLASRLELSLIHI